MMHLNKSQEVREAAFSLVLSIYQASPNETVMYFESSNFDRTDTKLLRQAFQLVDQDSMEDAKNLLFKTAVWFNGL